MNKKNCISVIVAHTIPFAFLATLLCYTLSAAEPNDCAFISKKTATVDNYYMALMNDKGTDHTSSDQNLCCAVRTPGSQDIFKVWVPTEIEYAYEVNLFDRNSNSVPKTELGKKVGTKFSDFGINAGFVTPQSKPQVTGAFTTNQISAGWLVIFRPSDYFEINKSGDYNLQIRFQMVGPVGTEKNRQLKVIRFSALNFSITKP